MTVSGHSGKTDSQGGHYDYQDGGYHYHHGYPAHEHTNGECPYDFEDNEKDNSKIKNEETKKTMQSQQKKSPRKNFDLNSFFNNIML